MSNRFVASTALTLLFVIFLGAIAGCSSREELHKDVVKLRLVDPDSAQFKNIKQSKRENDVWCGELNSKNRMGGFIGFQRYVIQTIGFGKLPAEEIYVTRFLTEEGQPDEFASAWRLFCE